MTSPKKNALDAVAGKQNRIEGEHRSNPYKKEETMKTSLSTHEFEELLTVEARLAGGRITLEPEFVDWLGDTFVRVEIPGLISPLMLRTFEARDLALALLNSAAYIDEQAPREITRCTEPGNPSFEEAL